MKIARTVIWWSLVGHVIGWLVRCWAWTWRTQLFAAGASFPDGTPIVYAFWHGQQMALVSARLTRPTAVLVSWSRDGELQTGVMRSLGLRVVRGSSSRGGLNGFRQIVRSLKQGADAAMAVDGPRGPAGRAKPGAAVAARLAEAVLLPVASAASSKWVLRRTWDRFELPLPFARVAIVVGSPVSRTMLSRISSDTQLSGAKLAAAINAVRRQAERQVGIGLGDNR
ncbi:lysophospholipid acyltransferase family protein [Myxococcota bacterium]